MSELIHQFGIDWRLLVAQAVNFGILFFVLWRFAYRPMLQVFSERRKKIQEGMLMREEAEQRLEETSREKEAILKKAEAESLFIVTKAETLGQEKGGRVISEAMKKSEELIHEGKKRAEEERKVMAEEFSKEASEMVRVAVAKVIEQAPETIDEALVEKALAELKRV